MVSGRKMLRVPVPGGLDDRLQIMARRPADRPIGERVVGHKRRRIACATWPVFDLEISADDAPKCFKQFLHGRPVAGAEIEGVALPAVEQMFDRARMRVRKIEHMNEIPHAGPVARIIVRAKHLEVGPSSQSRIHCDRDGMRFRRMPLADAALGVGAGSVEIAQDEGPEALVLIQVSQDLLDDQLASAIWIDR